jgi:hypothetical protein
VAGECSTQIHEDITGSKLQKKILYLIKSQPSLAVESCKGNNILLPGHIKFI